MMEPMEIAMEMMEPMGVIANKRKKKKHRNLCDVSPPIITHYTEDDIRIIDDAIPVPLLEGALNQINEQGFTFGWHSNRNKEFSHWNTWFAGKNSKNRNDITKMLNGDVATIWSLIQYQYAGDVSIPIRVYANGYTFGTEGYIHTDSKHYDDLTFLLYMNEHWDRDWAGETMFFNGEEVIKAVLPKWNRLVIFPAKMEHCARSVSRICSKLRMILVYKARREQDHDATPELD